MKQKLFLFAAVFLSIAVFGQSQKSLPVLLNSGTIESDVQFINPTPTEWVEGKFYRLVQFSALPSKDLKESLTSAGIEFHEYIPKNTYLVSLENKANLDLLKDSKAIFAIPFQSSFKLSKNLKNQNYPEWSFDGEYVSVLAVPYPGTTLEIYSSFLANYPFEELIENKNFGLWEVKLKPENLGYLIDQPFIYHVQEAEEPGQPENLPGRGSHRSNAINTLISGGRQFDGSGVVISVGDDGAVHDHIDYQGRILFNTTVGSRGDHGDHVIGTIFGAGNLNPDAEGMAKGAEIAYYNYPSNLNQVDQDYGPYNIRITSSSYSNGCNAGYTQTTQRMDQDIIQNPFLMHVFSAGNAGISNCGYGAGAGWGNVTGGHKIGKNVIAVANIRDDNTLNGSSSVGPASDGRIKPDVAAVGTNVLSTVEWNQYASFTGTSMSCPGTSGTLAQLWEAYRFENNNAEPDGGLMKAILLNGADDLGNAGPDFKHGYGRINALRSVKVIENSTYFIDSVSNSGSKTHNLTIPQGTKNVRIMLYWTDPAASTSAARALVNDLDLEVESPNGTTTFLPWVLDPTPNSVNLNSLAVRAVDTLNNIEQVTFSPTTFGTYSLKISGTSVPFGPQKYYLVYIFEDESIEVTYPIGNERIVSNSNQYIRWNTESVSTANFTVEYTTDNGSTWQTLSSNVPSNRRYFLWNNTPNLSSKEVRVKVSRGNVFDESDANFHLSPIPSGLKVAWACSDSFRISWNHQQNIANYIIYQLGAKYMDSVDVTSDTGYVFRNMSTTQDYWLAISSIDSNGVESRRTLAIQKTVGDFNCRYPIDLALSNLITPAQGEYPLCGGSVSNVKVKVSNPGLTEAHGFSINYQLGVATPVSLSPSDTLQPGDSKIYTLPGSLSISNGTTYNLSTWVALSGDYNLTNDTVVNTFKTYAGTQDSLYFTEDFDSWSRCGTASNCGQTVCNAANGWVNQTNGSIDDIDFRTHSGSTPSGSTGPSRDHTGNGNYLYLEASNGCIFNEARLNTPCIDLTTATQPVLSFWYHMYGADQGSLKLAVVADGEFYKNIIPTIEGDQGNAWRRSIVDLSAFAGKNISIQFIGVTGNDYRSDLALDDIEIFDAAVSAPSAGFTSDAFGKCIGDTVTFTAAATGAVQFYNWEFGSNAQPQTATTAGPHKVVYSSAANQVAKLTVGNTGGINNSQQTVLVGDQPIANFSISFSVPATYSFFDQSAGVPTKHFWDFGDGNTDTTATPVHTYQQSGTFTVTYVAENECGKDTTFRNLVSYLNVTERTLADNLKLFPNPNNGEFQLSGFPATQKGVNIEIVNSFGQVILKKDKQISNGSITLSEGQNLPTGNYILRIILEDQILHKSFVKK